jgi:hypothetical protein
MFPKFFVHLLLCTLIFHFCVLIRLDGRFLKELFVFCALRFEPCVTDMTPHTQDVVSLYVIEISHDLHKL